MMAAPQSSNVDRLPSLRASFLVRAFGAGIALSSAFQIGPAFAMDCKSYPGPGTDWHDCDKSNLMLSGSDLSGANLVDTDFTSTDLRQVNLAGANLEKATLVRSSLSEAQAQKANFARIEAYRTSFAGMAAAGASFAGAEIQRADFTGADLTGADFQKAELGRAQFDKAVITGTKFMQANLSRADFRGAQFEGLLDFTGAFLFLTRFEGLNLTAATGLEQRQVDQACGDAATKLPSGISTPSSWPCTFD
jgi:uncharacterized protein YjbI with pentapeptide repeats